MFVVMKNGKKWRKLKQNAFETYEQARSFVRTYIRGEYNPDTRLMLDRGAGEREFYNPSISAYGFRIQRACNRSI